MVYAPFTGLGAKSGKGFGYISETWTGRAGLAGGTMTRRAIILRRGAAAAAAAFFASAASANPWPMPEGEGRVILTGVYSHADKIFDSSGKSREAPDYDQLVAYFLTEYGLTDNLTLVANPALKKIDIEDDKDHFGLENVELGARYRLFQNGNWVVSAQASAFVPGTSRNARIAQIGGSDFQAEGRLQAGYGFTMGTLGGFTALEGAYRFRSGDPPNEYHLDATLGVHATKRLLVIGNLFNTWSDGRGSNGFPSYRYSNLYAGGVYDVSKRLSLQLGGLATLSGRNALRERGLYTGFWIKF